jgi:hypothetical protein
LRNGKADGKSPINQRRIIWTQTMDLNDEITFKRHKTPWKEAGAQLEVVGQIKTLTIKGIAAS